MRADRHRFGRDARMLAPAEFDRCLRYPALVRTGPFALHLCPGPPAAPDGDAAIAGAPDWRLGLVIPKRFEASAVARNTIKRRWRDAFRRGRVAWAGEFGSADVVVRMQSPLLPKPPKPAGKTAKRSTPRSTPHDARSVPASASHPVSSVVPLLPAKVRARRFDPGTALTALVERLRTRGVPSSRPARTIA